MTTARLVLVRNGVSAAELDRIDARATVTVLSEAAARDLSDAHFDLLVRRRSLLIVAAGDAAAGSVTAAGLLSDWFALGERGTLDLRQPWRPEVAAGLHQRLGRGMMKVALSGSDVLDAGKALEEGLVDALVPDRADPLQWARDWLGTRSLLSLHSAARLIRLRGGDPLERAEFARLFAAGEPQRGLRAFLAREPSQFSEQVETETV